MIDVKYVATIFFVSALHIPLSAHAESSLWQTDRAWRKTKVISWGPHCGVKPKKTGRVPKKKYKLTKNRIQTLDGKQVLFGRGACRLATGLPDLKETVKGNTMRCRSNTATSTSVSGRIRQKHTQQTLELTHRFEYEWRLNESHCHTIDRWRWQLSPLSSLQVTSKTK